MFKNEFQGGTHFEVFSAQGKDPTANWKLTGVSGIKKEFDKSVKSYVYNLDGPAATTKMQLPKDHRHTLALIQRYLVVQLMVSKGADFSVDIGIQDASGSKRRLHFSTAIRDSNITPLHSKVPLGLIKRDVWCNLCIDLSGFVSETWVGQTFKSVDSMCFSANCRLRRIFTMRSQPPDTTNDEEVDGSNMANGSELESIPRQCQLAPDIGQVTQVLTFNKVLHYEGKRRPPPEIVLETSSGSLLDTLGTSSSRHPDGYHIAFGTKMPGTGHRKASGRESLNSSRSSKSHSTRFKSDSHGDLPPPASSRHSSAPVPSHSDPGKKHLQSSILRTRKNSDPGANQEDPEMSVDKDSLRTSHTWTDGADTGKESIPFVKPYPPRQPSADRIRRKPRVKSAGKERTPHGGAVMAAGRQDELPSSTHSSASSRRSSEPVEQPAADPEQLERVLVGQSEQLDRIQVSEAELLATAHKVPGGEDAQRNSHEFESESNSQNTSGVADDSLDEVIHTLRNAGLDDPGEYEDSENEEDEDNDQQQVFLYSSKPKTAPRHKKTRRSSQHASKTKDPRQVARGVRADRYKTRMSIEESDFVRAGSSDEDDSIGTRVLRNHPSHRHHNHSSTSSGGVTKVSTTGGPKSSQKNGGTTEVGGVDSDDGWYQGQNGHDGPLPLPPKAPPPATTAVSTPGRGVGARMSPRSPHGRQPDRSPIGSQSRMSIRKKSLREIPKDDVRLSQPSQKAYSPDKYAMADLSESYEAAMLLSLRRQTLEEGVAESDEEEAHPPPHQHSHLHYSDHSLSDTSDDTSMSTSKRRHAVRQKMHNYQEEMKSDFLNHSNPRDWGNVFSPPIVFPSQKTASALSPASLQVPIQNGVFGQGRGQPPTAARDQGDTDEEDELDLLYDPVLNCYFDPTTCKYYELV